MREKTGKEERKSRIEDGETGKEKPAEEKNSITYLNKSRIPQKAIQSALQLNKLRVS